MFLKKKSFIFVVFIILVFALLTYQSIKDESYISDFFLYPLRVLEQASSTIIKSLKNSFNTYVLIIGKEEENKRLVDRINRFQQEKNQHIETKYENERLRKLLKLKTEQTNYVTAAEVFARDSTNWFQILWINKGMDDGIFKDMIAVTPLGAVGRVHRVLKNRADIILITDINSSVAVRIQSSRIEGILQGSGDDKCYLKYVPQDVDVMVGEKVITSGLDGVYPEGLQIGYVTDVKKKAGKLFQIIGVATAQNLNTIEEVAILKR